MHPEELVLRELQKHYYLVHIYLSSTEECDSNYSYEYICDYCKFEFENYNEMIEKCNYLLNNPNILKKTTQYV